MCLLVSGRFHIGCARMRTPPASGGVDSDPDGEPTFDVDYRVKLIAGDEKPKNVGSPVGDSGWRTVRSAREERGQSLVKLCEAAVVGVPPARERDFLRGVAAAVLIGEGDRALRCAPELVERARFARCLRNPELAVAWAAKYSQAAVRDAMGTAGVVAPLKPPSDESYFASDGPRWGGSQRASS